MRILVITDRFYPEIAAPSFRLMDHAKVWNRKGHEVTVVTCVPNFPGGVIFPGYVNKWYQTEFHEGIRIVRLRSYMAPNQGFFRRIVDYSSFMLSAVLQCLRFPAFDIILASSPPLFTTAAGYAISKIRRRPWVFELRDLWPASIKALGIRTGGMFKVLESIELFLYNRSDGIISLTGSFKADLVKRGVAADHITVIENAVDAALFFPQPRDPATSNALGADPDDFLVGYIGTIGMAHGLETMVQAAALCRDTPHIRFLLMGEGSERKALEEQARSAGLKNVVFKDFVPHKEVPKYLASLSAMVVHLRPHPLFRTVIPSKIFEAMAMGVPLIHAVEGESATIVNAAGAGVCIPPGSPEALAEAILMLARNSPGRLEMSKNGVEYATRNCSRETKAVMALDFMERVARSKE